MSSTIVVGLALREDDAAVLALAGALGGAARARLQLVHAVALQLPGLVPIPSSAARAQVPAYADAMQRAARRRLGAVVGGLPAHTVAGTQVAIGSPSRLLHDSAAGLGAAAVVVGASHRGAAGRVLIGDVGAGLLHGTPCPVAIAPREFGSDHALSRIGVAFDGGPESDQALAVAIAIAGRTGGSVRAYTVVEPSWEPIYIAPGTVVSPAYERRRDEAAQAAADRALMAIPADIGGTAEIVHGPLSSTLAELSSELDLIVCGSRGYGALHAVAGGSVARSLAHRAACPLIVVPRALTAGARALWTAETLGQRASGEPSEAR